MRKEEIVQEKSLSNDTANRTFKLTVFGYTDGMNKLLNAFRYDYKTKRIYNNVKSANDKLCITSIRLSKVFRNVTIQKPIVIHYKFYWRDKKMDRMNIASAFDKSFEDALQKTGIIKNDGWDDVINATFDFAIDRQNPRVEVVVEEIDGTDYRNYM